MIGANATEVQIDTDAHSTMTRTEDHDHVAEVQGEGGNHERVAPARNTRHTVAQNHLLPQGTGMATDNVHGLVEVMVLDTVAEGQIT